MSWLPCSVLRFFSPKQRENQNGSYLSSVEESSNLELICCATLFYKYMLYHNFKVFNIYFILSIWGELTLRNVWLSRQHVSLSSLIFQVDALISPCVDLSCAGAECGYGSLALVLWHSGPFFATSSDTFYILLSKLQAAWYGHDWFVFYHVKAGVGFFLSVYFWR